MELDRGGVDARRESLHLRGRHRPTLSGDALLCAKLAPEPPGDEQ